MNAQILTFSANEQTLIKTGGIDDFASNTVRYAKATFTLGTNWTGFDSVRAVWRTACYTISTVLDANHSCDVPPEVLSYKAKVYVNLVGSISENGVLTDRLTTFPVLAMHIKSNAPVEGTETAPITASQFEQFVETVQDAADSISDYSYDSEAWAVGKRGGVDVPSTDETYHNNSKYWAEQNAGLSDDVADLKSDLSDETSARILLAGRVTTAESDIDTLETHKVAQPLDGNNQPTNGTSGQSLRTKGDGTTEWADVGLPTDEQTAQAVTDWLNAHPEATTTVQDGSLTEVKFTESLRLKTIKDYVTPEMFGAKGDGSVDDSGSIMDAIEYASLHNISDVVFIGKYRVDTTLVLRNYRQDMDNKPVNLIMANKGQMFDNCLIANTGEACIELINTHYINASLNIISSGYSSVVFDNPIPVASRNPSTIGIIATRENSGRSASSLLNTFGGTMRFQSDPTANSGYGTIGIYSDTSEEEIFESVALMADTPIIITISDIANLTNNPVTTTCKDHRFEGHNHLISHENKCVVLDGAINIIGTIYVNCESDDATTGSGIYISDKGVDNASLNIDAEKLKYVIDGSSSAGVAQSYFDITTSAIACVVHGLNIRNCRFLLSCYFYTGLDRYITDNNVQTNCEFILQYVSSGTPNKIKAVAIYNSRFLLNNYFTISQNVDNFIDISATGEKRYETILANGVTLNGYKSGFDWSWGKPSGTYNVGKGFIVFDRSSNIQNANGNPVGWYYDGAAFRPFGQVSVRTISTSDLSTTTPRFKGEIIVDDAHKSHVAYGENAGEWSDMN